MQKLLGTCVNNAQNKQNSLNEIYYCYALYNNGFKQLKLIIKEESIYYGWYIS